MTKMKANEEKVYGMVWTNLASENAEGKDTCL